MAEDCPRMNYLKHNMAGIEGPTTQSYQKWNLTRLSKPLVGHRKREPNGTALDTSGEGKHSKKGWNDTGAVAGNQQAGERHLPALSCFFMNLCDTQIRVTQEMNSFHKWSRHLQLRHVCVYIGMYVHTCAYTHIHTLLNL